ncbi:amidohydrolase [Microlunatus endophyticus]|uniref:Amidohydrolase n=1 Tax=Microlunatus endophyticus TaxID=1716077 RepID=A0A917SIH8_9ACTN|nr:amidohydrolase family protein [Microlunatus endophyticus]GGL82427.1 amidohydrolase [Microlunatus endophyticus]
MEAPTSFIIRPDRVFDGVAVQDDAEILVRDGMIIAVGPGLSASDEIPCIGATGATLIPGLIDAHAHVGPGRLEQALVFGVTTVLDMFNDPGAIAGLKTAAESSPARMASVFSAGTGATAPGRWPWWLVEAGVFEPFPTVSRVQEVETFVADRIAAGSDYIKIFSTGDGSGEDPNALPAEVICAIIQTAHRYDRLAVVHAQFTSRAVEAIELGADGLMHAPIDRRSAAHLAEIAAQCGVFVVPTMGVLADSHGTPRGTLVRDDPFLGPYLDDTARGFLSIDRPSQATAERNFDHLAGNVSELNDLGVPLLAGTDATNPGVAHGASLHDELILLTDAGLTPEQALTAATQAPAQAFGLTDQGSIEAGRRADLVLVDGDPTRDISATRRIRQIWHRGVPVVRR